MTEDEEETTIKTLHDLLGPQMSDMVVAYAPVFSRMALTQIEAIKAKLNQKAIDEALSMIRTDMTLEERVRDSQLITDITIKMVNQHAMDVARVNEVIASVLKAIIGILLTAVL